MTTFYSPTLTWYRVDGGYMNREGFGLLMNFGGQYHWQAPQRSMVTIRAKSCAEAKRVIDQAVQSVSVTQGSQWRGYCRSCGGNLRSWDSAQGLGEAIINHLRTSAERHPEFVR